MDFTPGGIGVILRALIVDPMARTIRYRYINRETVW